MIALGSRWNSKIVRVGRGWETDRVACSGDLDHKKQPREDRRKNVSVERNTVQWS